MTTPFPEPESPALERFALYSRVGVVALLGQMAEHRVLTNVYYDATGSFFLTVLLSINPDFEQVVIDSAPNEGVQRRVLESRRLVFVAFVQGVKLQFEAARAEAISFEDRPALRVRLPERVIRMQRREFFRVRPLANRPVRCCVRDVQADRSITLRVLDISGGGLALVCKGDEMQFSLGMELPDCVIDLPGEGSIGAGLRVRAIELTQQEGEKRIGCEFVQFAPQASLLLQRYINQVEAEHRKGAPDRNVT
ncbi:MAG: flagellar brake protein [Gemmatimonadota bacterium]